MSLTPNRDPREHGHQQQHSGRDSEADLIGCLARAYQADGHRPERAGCGNEQRLEPR
jgi:hypothetical protein